MTNYKITQERLESLIQESIKNNILEGQALGKNSSLLATSADNLIKILEPEWDKFDSTVLQLMKAGTERAVGAFNAAINKLKPERGLGIIEGILNIIQKVLNIPIDFALGVGPELFNFFVKTYKALLGVFTVPMYSLSQSFIRLSVALGDVIRSLFPSYKKDYSGNNCGANGADYFRAVANNILTKKQGVFNKESLNEKAPAELSSLAAALMVTHMPNTTKSFEKGKNKVNKSEAKKVRNILDAINRSSLVRASYGQIANITADGDRTIRAAFKSVDVDTYNYVRTHECKADYISYIRGALIEIEGIGALKID